MKYRIGNTVINSDQIVRVDYYPNKSRCDIFTGSDGVADVVLHGDEADRFWSAYSLGAIDVMLDEGV